MIKKFKSDGCSLWPDGNYRQCCVEHDRKYYAGGTGKQRLDADLDLMQCVKQQGRPMMGIIMFIGVRLFGVPWLPTPFRWGFGRPYFESWKYDQ